MVLLGGATLFLSACGKAPGSVNIDEGMNLIGQHDYEGALKSFETAALYNEDAQLLHRGEGIAYMGMGKYDEAAEAFLESISYARNKVTELEFDTNYYLAASYMKQGKYKDAMEIYSAIVSLRKKDTDAYFLRACTLLKQQDYEAAVADFEKAFLLEPDNLELVIDAYTQMREAGFEEEGKAYIRQFMQTKEKTLKDQDKGRLLYYLGEYEEARSLLDPFMNGNDAEISLMLGKTYEHLGDMNYASVVYQTYLDGNVPDAAIYNSLGTCMILQGKYGQALENFEAGIALGDTQYLQNLEFNYIVANEYLGNFSKAKKLMDEYMAKYPDDVNAKKEAEFLQTR